MTKSTPSSASRFGKYEPVIGLEVHCQLSTQSKLFCSCSTEFGELPNTNTCEICLAHPGTLPVINERAIDFAIRFALGVGASISEKSEFSRKQYFYPDLPKGYQISQYDRPYCQGGAIILSTGKAIGLTRAHMEEDAGKNVHGDHASYVDLNRAGVPLVEIVSEPEIRSPEEAGDYLRQLRAIVRYLEICDGNLEEGSFRCDANVSVRLIGAEKFGTKVEVKNLNSFKNIEKAISYEIERQIDDIESGRKISQQTMMFDPASGKTKPMRTKEDAHDYRYFPEPDLPLLVITPERIAKVQATLPKLPAERKKELIEKFQLTEYDATQLTLEKELALFFESVRKVASDKVESKIIANWILSEYLREFNNREWTWENPKIGAKGLSELLDLIATGVISGKIAKEVFPEMAETGESAISIVKRKNLLQISDPAQIEACVKSVVSEFPAQVAEYKSGKTKIYGFFVGQVLKRSEGKFNPELVNSALKAALDKA